MRRAWLRRGPRRLGSCTSCLTCVQVAISGGERASRESRDLRWLAARSAAEQAEGAGPVDRLGTRVRAELCVDVADVGPDGVGRQVQLDGDLGSREVAGQVAEDLELARAEGFV